MPLPICSNVRQVQKSQQRASGHGSHGNKWFQPDGLFLLHETGIIKHIVESCRISSYWLGLSRVCPSKCSNRASEGIGSGLQKSLRLAALLYVFPNQPKTLLVGVPKLLRDRFEGVETLHMPGANALESLHRCIPLQHSVRCSSAANKSRALRGRTQTHKTNKETECAMSIYICTHIRTWQHARPSIPPSVPPSLRPSVRPSIQAYIPIHARMHTYIFICIYIYVNIPTYLPTYLPTYIHTYIHTYIFHSEG